MYDDDKSPGDANRDGANDAFKIRLGVIGSEIRLNSDAIMTRHGVRCQNFVTLTSVAIIKCFRRIHLEQNEDPVRHRRQ